jgi:hypothetical protein
VSEPVVHDDGTVVRDEPAPARVVIRLEFAGGAYREFTASSPLDWQFAVAPSDGQRRSEPRIALMFAGNKATGGITVSQEGVVLALGQRGQFVGEDDAFGVPLPVWPERDLPDEHPVALGDVAH